MARVLSVADVLGGGQEAPSQDMSNQYNTALTAEQQPQYEAWLSRLPKNQQNTYDYDMQGAFLAGVSPSKENGHFPDTFKKPNHPTFSVESQYAKDAPEKAGTWDGDTYVPASKAKGQIDPNFGVPTNFDAARREAGGLADMVLGFPAFLAKMGTRGAISTVQALRGDEIPATTAAHVVDPAMKAPWMKLLSNPIEFLTGDSTKGSVVDKAGKVISSPVERAAQYWEDKTGRPDVGEAVRQSLDVLMGAGGDVAIQAARAARDTFKGKAAEPAPETPTATEPGPDISGNIHPAGPLSVAEVIAQNTGLADKGPSTKAAKARVTAAFKEPAEGSDYLGIDESIFRADERSRNRELWKQEKEERAAKEPAQESFPPDDSVQKTRIANPTILFAKADDLQSALAKQRAGKSFDMTAEERIALRDFGKRTVTLQQGKIDPDLLLGLGAAGLGLGVAALDSDQRDAAIGMGVMLLGATRAKGESLSDVMKAAGENATDATTKAQAWDGWKFKQGEQLRSTDTGERYKVAQQTWDTHADVPVYLVEHQGGDGAFRLMDADKAHELMKPLQPATPLGVALDRAPYTTKVLDRLPKNRTDFSRQMVEQEMARADVSAAEKATLQKVLDEHKGDSITAGELVEGFGEATKDWKLEAKATKQYADYGLDNIRPNSFESVQGELQNISPYGSVAPTTTLYRLPEHMEFSDANHFNDSRLFGWTRSFKEDGVRHVVEVQSDLAQHAKGAVPEGERAGLQQELQHASETLKKAYEAWAAVRNDHAKRNTAFDTWEAAQAKHDELKIKLEASAVDSQLSPIIKNWPRRLIQEELSRAKKAGEGKVRFASADTVAKVERWPDQHGVAQRNIHHENTAYETGPDPAYIARQEAYLKGPRFTPEHQSIYNRYAGDVTRYLKSLGGKEVTDSAGHGWIEVPTTGLPKNPKMWGAAEPRLLARMAAVGLGVVGGLALDPEDPFTAALLGAIGGGLMLKGAGSLASLRKIFAADSRLRIDHLVDDHEVTLHKAAIEIWREQNAIEKLAPDLADRQKITAALQSGNISKLTGSAKAAAEKARTWFSAIGEQAKTQGVLPALLDNYVTQLWDLTGENRTVWDKLQLRLGGPTMSPDSRFALARRISSIEEGKKLGLVPVTEDISAIVGIYGNALSRTMANKKLLESLSAAKDAEGNPLVVKMGKAPQGYVQIEHPQLMGKLVHPDIAPSMRYVFDNYKPGLVMKGLDLISTTAKRAEVSFSLFHAKALTDAYIGAGGNPLKIKGFLDGTNEYLRQLKQQGGSPLIDKAVEGGLKFSLERAAPEVEDVSGNGFYSSLEGMQKFADSVVPGSGLAVKGFAEANKLSDKYLWARLHAGMKLQIFAERYEALLRNNEALQPKEAAKTAASYTNDLFGGLNWRRIAEGVKNKFGRDIALALTSPHARAVERLLMFAPDWTVSTTRAAIKAFGKGTGIQGALPDALGGKPQTLADLHRQYLVRSAMYYLVVGNGINLALSGHNIWDNKDPTRIDLGNGQTMQWSKHTMEPVHWLTTPGQQAVNKLGVLPAEALDQALHVDYLNTKGRMPPMKNRAAHVLKRVVPIVGQSGTTAQSVASFFGTPIYGKAQR